ncbi:MULTISPECIES: site-specific integrase [unclassified Microbacterium]|uniref:tyrosine-type recombinase/integrase n=2 Tax=Microbacterium TaxID=33882 RepID=UPI0003DE33D9|nr:MULTISPECIES: site-specific integrase [unclassified Microbacterium]CDK01657.1 Phage-related integrase (modular protein) [Microbacterium sp. C448]
MTSGDGPASRIDPKTLRTLPEGIRYRADRGGKYQVRIWGVGRNGEWKERATLVDSLKEAKALRADGAARQFPEGSMRLGDWYERYWPTIRDSVRPATTRAYERGWRLRVQPWLGHRRLETITAGDVEQALTEWTGGASTKIDALAVLSRLLDGAVRAKLIPMNQARLARRPVADPQLNLRSRALTPEEVGVVLNAIPAGPYRNYLAGLIYTGMRANEAAALQVGDVDLDARSIHVHRSFSADLDGRIKEYTPKSHKERDVPIPSVLVPHLDDAMTGKSRSSLVFTGPKGGRINGSNVRRAIKWDAIRAVLDRDDYRLHDLRHTLATLLFDGGAAANDVQAIMGHSTLQMTERYSRARSDAARRGAERLDGLFGVPPRSGPSL